MRPPSSLHQPGSNIAFVMYKITEPSAGPNRTFAAFLTQANPESQLRQPDAARPAYYRLLPARLQSGNKYYADCPAVTSHCEYVEDLPNLTERSPLWTAHIPLVPPRRLVLENLPQGIRIPRVDVIPGLRELKQNMLHERKPAQPLRCPIRHFSHH
jgi:hypothetical protein